MAAREAKYLSTLFNALGTRSNAHLFFKGSVDLFSDSQGVVAVSANPVLSAATKHVDIADFYVRELVEGGLITVTYVKTDYMVADVLTKPLARVKFYGSSVSSWVWFGMMALRQRQDSTQIFLLSWARNQHPLDQDEFANVLERENLVNLRHAQG